MQELLDSRKSIIHQYDARVKIIFTLAIIISLNLTPNGAWAAYIMYLTLIVSLVILSRIGIGFVFKRALLALPFVLAALPLIFTGSPPRILWQVSREIFISLSTEGIVRFLSISFRSWISIQAAILLTSTTSFPELITAFQQMKVPRLFVAIIELMWRYLFIIRAEAVRMIHARASRSAMISSHRSGGTILWRGKVTGTMAGSLFLRSLERSDRVYAAMLSRGYNGKFPSNELQTLSKKQIRIIVFGLLLIFLFWLFGLFTGWY